MKILEFLQKKKPMKKVMKKNAVSKKKATTKKTTRSKRKLTVVKNGKEDENKTQPQLIFQNQLEEILGINNNPEFCSALYAAVVRFHNEIEALNAKHKIDVDDVVYFKKKSKTT